MYIFVYDIKRTICYIIGWSNSPSVIKSMIDSYQEPTTDEGFDSIIILDNRKNNI